MCILDLEESEVTNDGTQELWEMTRTAVIRGLITSCDGSFLMFGTSGLKKRRLSPALQTVEKPFVGDGALDVPFG